MSDEIVKEEVVLTAVEAKIVQPFEIEIMFSFVLSMAQDLEQFESRVIQLEHFLSDERLKEFKSIKNKLLYKKLLSLKNAIEECTKKLL